MENGTLVPLELQVGQKVVYKKYSGTEIKENQKALVIFPTGTRYSNEMKGGAVMIARLAKAPIVPMVVSRPLTFKDIIKRKKMHDKNW